jgi:hypothetical protein
MVSSVELFLTCWYIFKSVCTFLYYILEDHCTEHIGFKNEDNHAFSLMDTINTIFAPILIEITSDYFILCSGISKEFLLIAKVVSWVLSFLQIEATKYLRSFTGFTSMMTN